MKKYNKILLSMALALIGAATVIPAAAQAADENELPAIPISDGSGKNKNKWFTDDLGRRFYYGSDGKFVTGEQTINGVDYLFAQNGIQKTGWRTVNGKRCFFDADTGESITGWFDYCGKKYYISPDDGKLTGAFSTESGDAYVADEFGIVTDETGFISSGEKLYFVPSEGMLQTEFFTIGETPYFVDENCCVQTGWQKNGSDTYYICSDGSVYSGITSVDGKDYFFNEYGKLLTGLIESDGKKYFAGEDSTLEKGLVTIQDSAYYFGSDYAAVSGLVEVGKGTDSAKLYCFGNDGKALTGMQETNGKTYIFGEDGSSVKGWYSVTNEDGTTTKYYVGDNYELTTGLLESEGKYYCFSSDGKLCTNCRLIVDGEKYCFGEDGAALTGFQSIEGKTYCFGADGKMLTGWQTDGTDKYYLTEKGEAATGWTDIDGKTYFFTEKGVMLTGRQAINGQRYYLGEDGARQYGLITLSDGTYYFGKEGDGKLHIGWQTIDGKMRFFDAKTGVMYTNMHFDYHIIDADGVATEMSDAQKKAVNTLKDEIKDVNVTSIYNFVRSHNVYKYMEPTRSLAEINQKGWAYFANYAFDNRQVVCYYMAAITDALFQEAGYKSRVVYGTGRGEGDHYWNQVNIDGKWLNYDTCNGFAAVTDDYLKTASQATGRGYVFRQYVYPNFNK